MDQCKTKLMRSEEKNRSVTGSYDNIQTKSGVKDQQILLERVTSLLLLYIHMSRYSGYTHHLYSHSAVYSQSHPLLLQDNCL